MYFIFVLSSGEEEKQTFIVLVHVRILKYLIVECNEIDYIIIVDRFYVIRGSTKISCNEIVSISTEIRDDAVRGRFACSIVSITIPFSCWF